MIASSQDLLWAYCTSRLILYAVSPLSFILLEDNEVVCCGLCTFSTSLGFDYLDLMFHCLIDDSFKLFANIAYLGEH